MVHLNTDLKVKNDNAVHKTGSTEKNEKSVSIMGTDIVKDTQADEALAIEKGSGMETMDDYYGQISNVAGTLKDLGCHALYGLANSAVGKAKGIVTGVSNQLKAFDSEIKSLYADKNLTEDELNKKIEFIEAKKKAIITEGEAKMAAVSKISDMFLDLVPAFLKLQQMGVNLNDYTQMITELLGSISSSPSSLTGAKTQDDLKKITQKNIKNMFGSCSTDKLGKFTEELDKKIDTAKEKLSKNDTKPEEKEQLKTEIEVYKTQKKLFKEFFKQLDGIKLDES